jgi:aminoglycoside phosphotransferase (APT) family kinase protein
MRSKLSDNVAIKFTHGDLHPSNILLSPIQVGTPPRIIAIIDWHQSGWLLEYWEFCKAQWTAWAGEEWERDYLPRVLERHDVYDIWDYFVIKLGL